MRRWKQIWQTRPHILKSGCPHIMERYARKDGFILWSNSHFHFIISQSMTSFSPPYIWRALFCTVEKYSNLRGSLLLKKIFPRVRCKELIWMVRRAQRWPIPDTIALPMQLKAMRSHCKRHSTQIHFNSQNFDAIFSSWPLTTLALQGALKWMSRSGRQTIFLQFSGETLCRDNCQLIGIVFLVIHLY